MSGIINTVAEKLRLPAWWVESIAIEYTECREYAEGGKIWTFNWSKIPESDLEEAVRSHKVVVRDVLIHNIQSNVFPSRAADRLAGGTLPPMVEEPDDLIPEGLVSYYSFLLSFNSLDIDDPRLSFSQWYQVLDNGKFWQWRIAERANIEGRNYSKWTSKEIDLEPLDQIHERLISLRKSAINSGEPGHAEFKLQVKKFYQWLDELRRPILLALYDIHSKKRQEHRDFPKATTGDPPLLSHFEMYTVRNHRFYTKFFADPIFYRVCIQHAKRAEELACSVKDERGLVAKLDEIYQERSIAIILGAVCVEAFTNGLLSEHFPKLWKLIERLRIRNKLNVYLMLKNKGELSEINQSAHQFVVELFRHRDMLVHFKRDYQTLKQYKGKPVTYIGYRLSREFNRDLPNKLKNLIQELCEATDLPIPKWLRSSTDT